MSLKLGGTGLNENKLKCIIGIHGHWKNQNPGGCFGATSQTALPIQPIWPIFLVDRLNRQCCLAGSSKTAPRILIFSMAMDADYTFELIFNETWAPQFQWLNKSFLGSVSKQASTVHCGQEGTKNQNCLIQNKFRGQKFQIFIDKMGEFSWTFLSTRT